MLTPGCPRVESAWFHPLESTLLSSRRFQIDSTRTPTAWWDNAELDRLHGKLSQHFDIACVFTWIAGLLNLMAIWDAYEGPAYGYGDEEPDDDDDNEEKDGQVRKKQSN